MKVLALNAGSSSLKFRVFDMDDERELASGSVERIGSPEAKLALSIKGQSSEKAVQGETPAQAAKLAIEHTTGLGIEAVGHRIVDGGPNHLRPTRVTQGVLTELREAQTLDPLHAKPGLDGIETAMRLLPDIPQVVVFDTSFHQTMPEIAWRYAIPRELADRLHLRRYGFHGLSYQYVLGRLLDLLRRSVTGSRFVLCHLGSGASVCAVKDGKSVDTSMGLTPLEGLVMGTRAGDLDSGLLLHLMNAEKLDTNQVRDLLNKKSGLLGLAGHADVRDLEKAAGESDSAADLALEIFAYRVRKYIGAYAAALGGLDGLVFTGGIGERSSSMRGRICEGLSFLGLTLDDASNSAAKGDNEAQISRAGAPIWVIPTNEELQVARETMETLSSL
jgi:acetate kinase